MTDTPDDWGIRTAEKVGIALICPECGKENPEIIAHLQTRYRYACRGDGCTHIFDLSNNSDYRALIKEIADLCDKFDARPNKDK